MGMICKLIKTGLVIGLGITAYQASQKTKRETGSASGDTFGHNFMDQSIVNAKLVADTVKSFSKESGGTGGSAKGKKAGTRGSAKGKKGGTRSSAKGKKNGTRGSAEPAEDVISKTFETMKEKAPEVIDKVQVIVEDLRDNAPEYKEKAKVFIEDVSKAAKKALDKDDKETE